MKTTINNIAVFTEGNEENKPIVFVHGFPFDHTMWKAQVEALSKNYYCVLYDIRGLGESPASDGQYTMESFVDDLESLIDHMGLSKPVLCGLSMGGYISLRAVERMEEKLGGLILCDTKSDADTDEVKLKRAAGIKQINTTGVESFVEGFVPNCFSEIFIRRHQNDYAAVLSRSKQNSALGVKGCLLAMAGRTSTTGYLSKISVPTLVICGEEDKLTPPDVMMSMADKIHGSEFVVIEGAGHMAPVESPKEVNKHILKFLSKNNF